MKKIIILLGTFIVSTLMISSATAVQTTSSEPVINAIDKLQQKADSLSERIEVLYEKIVLPFNGGLLEILTKILTFLVGILEKISSFLSLVIGIVGPIVSAIQGAIEFINDVLDFIEGLIPETQV